MSHAEDTHDKLDAWWTARYAKLEACVSERDAEIERLRVEVAFFCERLEKQDGQYSAAHPTAARYRALREGLETRAEKAEARVAELERELGEAQDAARILSGVLERVGRVDKLTALETDLDAAHAETRDMQMRLTRVVDGSKVMRAKLATAVCVVEAARAMVTICQYPCSDPSKCGNCNALFHALAAIQAGDKGET